MSSSSVGFQEDDPDDRYKHFPTGHSPRWTGSDDGNGNPLNGNIVLTDYALQHGVEFRYQTTMTFDEEQPQQTRFRDLFNRRHFPFVLFVAAIWTCQVIPMFAIYTFGPQIVGLLGLGVGKNAALGNVVISLFFMLGCIPPMLWLNTAGRRPLLIGSFAMMTLALAVLGLIPDMGIWLVVMAFAVYAFFSGGPGNLQWLYPNELFPTDIRASAVGVIMSLSRIGTIVSTWALPIFINNYGISNTMLMGAGISLFGLLISVAFAPETRGMSLAQTSNMTIRGQRMG